MMLKIFNNIPKYKVGDVLKNHMTKTFCDRCGVETKKYFVCQIPKDKDALANLYFIEQESLHLCHLCFEGLKEYLKPKK